MNDKKLYFGHPVNTYGTLVEALLIQQIRALFPDWNIENPNSPEHDAGYKRWKEERGNGMKYFYEEVLPSCQGGAFLPFRDGAWGAGVFGEAEFLAKQGSPVWVIPPDDIEHLPELTIVKDLAEVRVLTIDETRARIRMPDGSSKPY